ncbi:uncharacterized protein LOC133285672 [Gastrolobium bilobum]|uniref:uncharacterized protein LOC133285672 n=1 Tax=Gastrolobium bilobum TaxID=150636 RepID=UPI002AB2EA34|nr:uncharacterized protein LOC133285672 [Gastrolobium bilobum]
MSQITGHYCTIEKITVLEIVATDDVDIMFNLFQQQSTMTMLKLYADIACADSSSLPVESLDLNLPHYDASSHRWQNTHVKYLIFSSGSPVHERSFKRPDPLRHFKYYNGYFDVRNKHYLSSAAFTGVHGYAFAGVWLLCGVAFGIFMMVKCLSGGSVSLPCLNHFYLHIFFLLLFLTSLAIVASSFVLATSQKTLQRTEKLKETVLDIGEDALGTLGRVCSSFRCSNHQLSDTGCSTRQLIDINLVSLIVCSLCCFDSVLLLLHWRPGFIIIIFLFWILTSLCWFLTGFDFFLHTFADDACSALEDFEENPQNSSLGSMLPCMNESFSGNLIAQIGNTIHNFIVELNSNMSVIYRLLGVGEENEELMGVIKICDPFSGSPNYSYIPQNCPQDAIRIGDLPKILARFTCHEEDKREECTKKGRFLPEASYNMAHAYSRSIQDLLDIYPDLERLSKCTIVKNKIAEIVLHQCRPIRIWTRLLWSSMMSLSIIMVVLPNNWENSTPCSS